MSIYEQDFYGWTLGQALLLKERDFVHLDVGNLIEELETMGCAEREQLLRRLGLLLMHVLKWHWQPDLRGHSWQQTIAEQRRKVALRELDQ